ncbi:MAG: hypothetical protein ACR2OB_07320 [Solirubrobacteraceae bacterium]
MAPARASTTCPSPRTEGGTLYIVDSGAGVIYRLRGRLMAGGAFASLDTVGTSANTTEVDKLNVSKECSRHFSPA